MMALTTHPFDPKLRKQNLLKDYLLDDLSSCSSNGFRSFPRRQCCTQSVRFLLEIDLANKNSNNNNNNHHQFLKPKIAAASPPPKSTLQKASQAVINAVKLLQVKPRKLISARNLSRKLFKRSFWKKSDRKEIQGWRSFHTVVEEKSSPSEFVKTTAATNFITTKEESIKSKKSYSGGSWSDSEFTRSYSSSCSSGNSEAVNSIEEVTVLPSEVIGKRVAVIVGEISTTTTTTAAAANCIIDTPKKQWPNEEAKEQFSPVSVLDCPFDNNDDADAEEEEVSSPFKRKLAHVEGKKHKLMQKLRRFESLTQLEPVDLEKRIALSDVDHESVGSGSPSQVRLLPIQENNIHNQEAEEEHGESDTKAAELLQQLQAKTPTVGFRLKADDLLLDFFKEGIVEDNANVCKLLDTAKDWINGWPQELFLGWEVQKNRQIYIRDMEKGGLWGNLEEYNQEVALELEAEIFTSLVNDLLLDICNLAT